MDNLIYLFPFSNITDDEFSDLHMDMMLNMNQLNIRETIAPFNFKINDNNEENKYVFGNGSIDPDANLYKNAHVNNDNSAYYTDYELNNNIKREKLKTDSFSIIHVNSRSLAAHFNQLTFMLSQINIDFDVIAITETWLDEYDTKTSLYQLENYDMYSTSRKQKSGGGVILYIKKSLEHKQIPIMSLCSDDCLETVGAQIKLPNNKKVIVGCVCIGLLIVISV